MGIKVLKPPAVNTSICGSFSKSKCWYKQHPSWAKSSELAVGANDGGIYRALLMFDLSVLPNFITILTGSFTLFLSRNFFPDITRRMEVYPILSKWNRKTVTWANQPIIGDVPLDTAVITNQQGVFLSLDLTTLVQNWYTNSAANFGVMLKMGNETTGNFVAFQSGNYANSQYWPYLEVAFKEPSSGGSSSCCRPLELTTNVFTGNHYEHSNPVNTLMYDFTYIVINTGMYPAQGYLEVSSNGVNWQIQSEVRIIQPGAVEAFVPDVIEKYSRFSYRSLVAGQGTVLTINIQGKS